MIAAAPMRIWELERVSEAMVAARARHAGVSVEFEDVYRRHADALYRFCLSQVGDPHLAEDVAADALTAAFGAWARVGPGADGVRPWLFRIARNAAVDRHRRRTRGRRATALLAAGSAGPAEVEARAELRHDLRAVVTAIAALPRRDRQLIGLRVAAGLPFSDVAAVMGMKTSPR